MLAFRHPLQLTKSRFKLDRLLFTIYTSLFVFLRRFPIYRIPNKDIIAIPTLVRIEDSSPVDGYSFACLATREPTNVSPAFTEPVLGSSFLSFAFTAGA